MKLLKDLFTLDRVVACMLYNTGLIGMATVVCLFHDHVWTQFTQKPETVQTAQAQETIDDDQPLPMYLEPEKETRRRH